MAPKRAYHDAADHPQQGSAMTSPHSKQRPAPLAALDDLRDGASIMVGGFGLCGNAEALIAAVVERGVGACARSTFAS